HALVVAGQLAGGRRLDQGAEAERPRGARTDAGQETAAREGGFRRVARGVAPHGQALLFLPPPPWGGGARGGGGGVPPGNPPTPPTPLPQGGEGRKTGQ